MASKTGGEVGDWSLPTLNLTPNFYALRLGMQEGFRVVSLEGGTRSGKTYAALQWIVLACLAPKEFLPNFDGDRIVVRCLRKEAANAKFSIWNDLNEILSTMRIYDGERGFTCNGTSLTWTFPNGSKIICGGAQDYDRLHGLSQDITFLNEVMQISAESFDQLNARTRLAFILDWNPSLQDHWVFRRGYAKRSYFEKKECLNHPERIGKPKCCYFHSTYKDNYNVATGESNLTDDQISAVEAYEPTQFNLEQGTANRAFWDVYGLGKRTRLEGRVVSPERIKVIKDHEFPLPGQWQAHGYGLDWGFRDPLALIECAIWNKKFYVRQVVYEEELTLGPNPNNPRKNFLEIIREKRLTTGDVIVADSARQDLNMGLRAAGYNVVDADKVAGSILNGVNLMNSNSWCVTEESTNVLEELEKYVWSMNRDGTYSNKPVDKYNHAMDACRYWLTKFLSPTNDQLYRAIEDRENNAPVEYGCEMPEYF